MRGLVLGVLLLGNAVPAFAAPADETCAVWARESGFAQSVADHDTAAFKSYLHPDAVFVDGGNRATRGVDAITAGWAGIIAGEKIVLRWYPDAVDVAADGALALSRGPYWMEFPGAPEDKRYLAGRFSSTWQRGADGQWLVVFDGGGGNVPVPATAAEVAALDAARKSCPVP
jgi:ketosteroid isomerase-like protein